MIPSSQPNPTPVNGGTAMILGSALGFGLTPMFAQVLMAGGFGPELVSLYRFALPCLVLLPFLALRRGEGREMLRMIGLGAIGGLGVVFYFRALDVLPASTAILIYYTFPVFSLLIGWIGFARPPTARAASAAVLIVAAVALVAGPQSLSGAQWAAAVACLVMPLGFALMIQYLAAPRRAMAPMRRLAGGMLGQLAVTAPVVLWLVPEVTLPDSGTMLAAALGLAVITTIGPQLLFVLGAPRAGADRTAIAGALELVVAMLTGAWLMGQDLGRTEVFAIALMLLALGISQSGGGQRTRTPPPAAEIRRPWPEPVADRRQCPRC